VAAAGTVALARVAQACFLRATTAGVKIFSDGFEARP
jgi:hypothetical protein